MIQLFYYLCIGVLITCTLNYIDEVKIRQHIIYNKISISSKVELIVDIISITVWPILFIILPLSGYRFRNWH